MNSTDIMCTYICVYVCIHTMHLYEYIYEHDIGEWVYRRSIIIKLYLFIR